MLHNNKSKNESFPWISTWEVLNKAIFKLTTARSQATRVCSLNAIHFYHTIIFTDNRQSVEIFIRLKSLSDSKKDLTMTHGLRGFFKKPYINSCVLFLL